MFGKLLKTPAPQIETEPYPQDPTELRTRLLNESTKTPQKIALAYFTQYVEAGGTVNHPILGDLTLFVQEIEDAWDNKKWGANFVALYLKTKLMLNTDSLDDSVEIQLQF